MVNKQKTTEKTRGDRMKSYKTRQTNKKRYLLSNYDRLTRVDFPMTAKANRKYLVKGLDKLTLKELDVISSLLTYQRIDVKNYKKKREEQEILDKVRKQRQEKEAGEKVRFSMPKVVKDIIDGVYDYGQTKEGGK
jgi:hypothetical protein